MADIIPTKPKEIGKVIVLGTGVIWGVGILAPLVERIPMMDTTVPVIGISLGMMLAAGITASLIQYAIITYWK